VTIFLIRHAHAGKRSEWTADDRLRPLSQRGVAQSQLLTEVVGDLVIGCMQTVEPLAEKYQLSIEESDAFAEGADGDAAYRLLLDLDAHDGVACSHGDVIPDLLQRLVADGMETDGPLLDHKGSAWIIELRNGRPFHGRYVRSSV
jgi:8-oxo-dGTP diphosphatase